MSRKFRAFVAGNNFIDALFWLFNVVFVVVGICTTVPGWAIFLALVLSFPLALIISFPLSYVILKIYDDMTNDQHKEQWTPKKKN